MKILKKFSSYGAALKRRGEDLKDYCKKLDEHGVDLRKYTKLFKTLALTLAFSYALNGIALGNPSTGYTALDNGAIKIVKGFQAVIFWASLLYTLKEFLTILVKKSGEVKSALIGLIVCIGSYAAPAVWSAIPKLFQ